ncbi:MAG: hypothetical protein H6741_01880 [Alphaproteobacteria bacterium]|nr:hypothetical protein [Alphaproteobacteria bacterium]MCB9791452.1 hypothetical protein [Alphaproteobacteria bacterium]
MRPRSVVALRTSLLVAALATLAGLVSCETSKDTGVVCDEICTSTLVLIIEGEPESFQLQVYGDDLPTINVFCPDGIAAGISQDHFLCSAGAITLERDAIGFPELLRVTLDGGAVQDVTPTYGELEEVCSTSCRDGEAYVPANPVE